MDSLDEFNIPEEVAKKLQDPMLLRQHIQEGKSFQELLGYSDETMEKFYQAAYNLFQKQKYKEAAEAFTFLTTLNPERHNYWLGLGMSEQILEEFHGALLAYAMAMMSDVTNPVPHYHSANCYRALLDDSNALISLEQAIQQAGDKDEHKQLLTAAISLKERLSRKK